MRTSGLVAVAVLLSVVAGAVLIARVGGGDEDSVSAPPAQDDAGSAVDAESSRAARASTALAALERAVAREDRAAFGRVFDDAGSASRQASRLFATLSRLPLRSFSLRYISEHLADLSVAERRRIGENAWLAEVDVRWALRGYDRREVQAEVDVIFADDGDRARIVRIGPEDGGRAPEWLLGPVRVSEHGDVLLLASPSQPRLGRDIERQISGLDDDVRRVLQSWRGPLVVVVPGSAAQMERFLGARPGQYNAIAAVTTVAGTDSDRASPVRIVVNPPVFAGLGPKAGRVVLAHEATHVATGATTGSDLPLWLVEGFADYVALVAEPVPVEVAAAQAIDRVRRNGPPDRLPGRREFATSAHGLGASYEAAWLACRLIAERHGERGLVRFYRSAETLGVAAAFRSVLDTGPRAFTREWRSYLRGLAA